MSQLCLKGVRACAARQQTLMPLRLCVGVSPMNFAPLPVMSRRKYHSTCTLLLPDNALPHKAHSDRVWSKTAAPPRTPPSSSSSSSPSSKHATRGETIRRTEELLRWLRRLVVPAFSLLGLFVLRPTEGHFLRYIAERRHLDTEFNAWFPPVLPAASPGVEGEAVGATSSASAADGAKRKNNGTPPSSPATPITTTEDVLAAFRTPQDREWAAQKFHYKKGSEDEERVARRRLLFARERAYMADDTVVETIRSPEAQMAELRALREHPPMHLIREQLDAMVEESKLYTGQATQKETPPSPPHVVIEFEDHRFFATGAVVFRDRSGHVGRTMRFVGACGMLWRQVS